MNDDARQNGYDENVIHQMIEMNINLGEHVESVEGSDFGHDQGPEVLINLDEGTKWCLDFDEENLPEIKIHFKRPVHIRGYSFTYANDAEHRDPTLWEVKIDDEQTEINHLQHDYDYKEIHRLHENYYEGPPERDSTVRFSLAKPTWTKKINFKFLEVRDRSEESLFQLGGIRLFC